MPDSWEFVRETVEEALELDLQAERPTAVFAGAGVAVEEGPGRKAGAAA